KSRQPSLDRNSLQHQVRREMPGHYAAARCHRGYTFAQSVVGTYKNRGRELRAQDDPEEVNVHDFTGVSGATENRHARVEKPIARPMVLQVPCGVQAKVSNVDLPRFGGHAKRRDNAPGASRGETKTPQ